MRNINWLFKLCKFSLLCLISISFFSCQWLQNFNFTPSRIPDTSGAMLVRHGAYIYKIGGTDALGSVLSSVYMAKIELDSEGNPLPLIWQETAQLPEGRAFGGAFAAGNIIYVLGGDNDDGPTSTIFRTAINQTDGSLGYGDTKYWQENAIKLDIPRAHFAYEVYDGRIYLIGGKTNSGVLDTIEHARVYPNGPVGQWYTSPQLLPSSRFGSSSTILNSVLYLAGGADRAGIVLDELVTFEIGLYGVLGNRSIKQLPQARYEPFLFTDGNDIFLGGGYDSEFEPISSVYHYPESMWLLHPAIIPGEGPYTAKAAGSLYYLEKYEVEKIIGNVKKQNLSLLPHDFRIAPGSGLVIKNTSIRIDQEPGVTVRYRNDSNDVTSTDAIWNFSSPLKITGTSSMNFRAFSSRGASNQISRQFRINSFSFIGTTSSGRIPIDTSDGGLETYSMRNTFSNPSSAVLSSVLCLIRPMAKTRFALSFGDQTTDSAKFTSKITLTLYEEDLITEAFDDAGLPILNRTVENSENPIFLTLNPGFYLLQIDDLDGLPGRSFGLEAYTR